jgi:hypothetical protein
MQWNHFRQTQLDSHSGHQISTERCWPATKWKPEQLKDQWVVDAHCSVGRFVEVSLLAGAKVLALDYSNPVGAFYENLKHRPNLHVVQGDIYSLPLSPKCFLFVYFLGVLQHTPDVAKAFDSLQSMFRRGEFFSRFLCEAVHIDDPRKVPFQGFHQTPNPANVVLMVGILVAKFAGSKSSIWTRTLDRSGTKTSYSGVGLRRAVFADRPAVKGIGAA